MYIYDCKEHVNDIAITIYQVLGTIPMVDRYFFTPFLHMKKYAMQPLYVELKNISAHVAE